MFKLQNGYQPIGKAILDSFCLLKLAWRSNLIIIFFNVVVVSCLIMLFGYLSYQQMSKIFPYPHIEMGEGHQAYFLHSSTNSLLPLMLLLFAGFFVCTLAMKIFNSVLVRASWNVARTGASELNQAFKIGLRYYWVYLLQILIMLCVGIAMLYFQTLISHFHSHALDVISVIVTQLVLYYLSVRLLFIDAAVVTEENGIRSFASSWYVTSGNWWRSLFGVLLPNLFYLVVLLLVGIGFFWVVFFPGIYPSILHTLVSHMPVWFHSLFVIVSVVTALAIIFTLPSMFAISQMVTYYSSGKNSEERESILPSEKSES